jgi:hypothetical protein
MQQRQKEYLKYIMPAGVMNMFSYKTIFARVKVENNTEHNGNFVIILLGIPWLTVNSQIVNVLVIPRL